MSAGHDKGSCDLFEQIQALYSDLALHPEKDFGWGKGKENARALGYNHEWLERLPDAVWESSSAVGNPFACGPIHPGETVIDLGCGAGADVNVAATLVGPGGNVIGVDVTLAMVQKARTNSAGARLANVRILESDMANLLPLPDSCADVVISNGAINLLPDKPYALKEAFRVLRPGGRFQIADMIRDESAAQSESVTSGSWANCVGGTVTMSCFLRMLAETGFDGATCLKTTGYRTSASTIGALFFAKKPLP
jgi:arsenite methyltransferase